MGQSSAPVCTAPGHPVTLNDGRDAWIRPLRPEDERFFHAFDRRVTDDDRRLRFFASLREISDRQIAALTRYDRTHADAVIGVEPDGSAMLGVARLHGTRGSEGEFALLVRSDLKGLGLGRELMGYLLGRARRIGIRSVHGFVLRENGPMLSFAQDLGFDLSRVPDEPDIVRAGLVLSPSSVERIAAAGV